jgi:hypothetical protein
MKNESVKIAMPEAKNALLRSGYLLEGRVAKVLSDRGYYVESNEVYADPETGKVREFDAYAIAARRAGPGEQDYLFPILVVECVNNPQPIAFITSDPVVPYLHYQHAKLSGMPVKVFKGREEVDLRYYLGMAEYHHYCKGRISTQYCSFRKKNNAQEWMALHEDSHFACLRTLCQVVDYQMDRHYSGWKFSKSVDESVNIQMYYPILVVQGELLEVFPGSKSLVLKRVGHIQYRCSTVRNGVPTSYQIDVVTEHYLPTFVDQVVDKEIAKTIRLMRRRHSVIRSAIDKIVSGAGRAKRPDKIRGAMEYSSGWS